MLPDTQERVPAHTAPSINKQIRTRAENRLAQCVARGPAAITQRLKELNREWDIERTLEINGSTLLLIGVALGAFLNVWWLLLPTFVGIFCIQHALQGWCPPIAIFRRLNIRTQREIDEERNALKIFRGDFDELGTPETRTLPRVLQAIRR